MELQNAAVNYILKQLAAGKFNFRSVRFAQRKWAQLSDNSPVEALFENDYYYLLKCERRVRHWYEVPGYHGQWVDDGVELPARTPCKVLGFGFFVNPYVIFEYQGQRYEQVYYGEQSYGYFLPASRVVLD